MNEYDNQNEIIVDGRRLRKIKRPKQYVAPIDDSFTQSPAPDNLPSVRQEQMYEQPAYATDEAYDYGNIPPQGGINAYAYGSMDKNKVIIVAMVCLLIGLLVGKFFFSSSSKVVQNGLQGVIMNPEVPQGRSRCGVAEKTQGCVLYLMNPERQELNGRDFYDWASQLTKRPRFVIETGNMRYSSVKIKPGFIAQINIPPLN